MAIRLAGPGPGYLTSHFRETVIPFLGSHCETVERRYSAAYLVFPILRRRISESHRKTSTTPAYHERRAKRLGH